jgi:hypothetical protein
MKYLIVVMLFCGMYSCQEKKAELIYFTHYELDTLPDTVRTFIEIKQQKEKEVVRVIFRELGYYTGEHIQGDFKVSNDTIILTYKYIEENDKNKDIHISHAPFVAYEYHFITDSVYTYIYDSHIMDSIRFPYYFR